MCTGLERLPSERVFHLYDSHSRADDPWSLLRLRHPLGPAGVVHRRVGSEKLLEVRLAVHLRTQTGAQLVKMGV